MPRSTSLSSTTSASTAASTAPAPAASRPRSMFHAAIRNHGPRGAEGASTPCHTSTSVKHVADEAISAWARRPSASRARHAARSSTDGAENNRLLVGDPDVEQSTRGRQRGGEPRGPLDDGGEVVLRHLALALQGWV